MSGRRALIGQSGGADAVLAAGLFLGTAVFVFNLAWFLGGDEGYYLYESKRLLDGAVFYRDLFDLVTPGAFYLLAALFRVFGVDMATARALHASTQGLIVALVYAACRVLGVRRAIAVPVALLQPAVFEPAWQAASPHWLATLGTLAVLVTLLRSPDAAVTPGLLAGLVIAIQQQKGVVVAAGGAASLIGAELVGGAPVDLRRLANRVGRYVAGMIAVPVPLVLGLVWAAGIAPVWTALVVFPLVNYRRVNQATWALALAPPKQVLVGVLAWLPAVTAVSAGRTIVGLVRGGDRERVRRSLVLAVMAVTSIASIAYYPDYVHLAFVGSIFAVLLGDTLEWGVGGLGERPRLAAASSAVLSTVALAAIAVQLRHVMITSHRDYPITAVTPFGELQFHTQAEVDSYARIAALARAVPTREVFGYPWGGMPHLLTGTDNPAPIQIFAPGYTTPQQIADALATLEERRVPLVVTPWPLDMPDPVLAYVARHYEHVPPAGPGFQVYRRRPDKAPGAPDAPSPAE